MIEDYDFEAWETRLVLAVSDSVQDESLLAVTYIDSLFIISGRNRWENDNGVSQIYIVNKTGELLSSFDQPFEGLLAYEDLTWDGELIWGVAEDSVFGFSFEGEIEARWALPFERGTALAMTWDAGNEKLWIAEPGSDIYSFDSDGNIIDTLRRRSFFSIYSLAYWQDDPDNFCIYAFDPGNPGFVDIVKFDIETGENQFVKNYELPISAQTQGIYITDSYDPYSTVMISIVNDFREDAIVVTQLDMLEDWFWLDMSEGEIEADNSQDLNLSIFTRDLLPIFYPGELTFHHNAEGGKTLISVNLTVLDVEDNYEQTAFPKQFSITQVSPNPSNSRFMIEFTLPRESHIQIEAYDLAGRRVAVINTDVYYAGSHSVGWDATGLPSGVYLLTLNAGEKTSIRKAVLLK